MPNRTRKPGRLYSCAWCCQRKPLDEMRKAPTAKGKAPSTCRACRDAHPDESWCDFHGGPHPADEFRLYWGDRPGYFNICRDATAYLAAKVRDKDPRTCVACHDTHESWFFRGGQNKSPVCRHCEDQHPGTRWCVDCRDWLALSAFGRNGRDGKFWAVRCKPCHTAHAHGTTVVEILRMQGSEHPECAACGSTTDLKVDHDHGCCPAAMSCGRCVRGYLCHECNASEGLLRTPERALSLAAYMTRVGQRSPRPKPPASVRATRRVAASRPSSVATYVERQGQNALW